MSDQGSITLNLAGINVCFMPIAPIQSLTINPDHASFQTYSTPEMVVKVFSAENSPPLPDNLIYKANDWTIYTSNGRLLIIVEPSDFYQINDRFFLLFDSNREVSMFTQKEHGDGMQVPPPSLDALLAIQLLAMGYGVMAHASAINASGRGMLFAGVSGTGKSTTAGLWLKFGGPGVSLLCDERVALRKEDGRFFVYGTPWHGEDYYATAGRVPLKEIFLLHQASHNSTRRLEPVEAVKRLFPMIHLPHWYPPGIEFILGFLDELCSTVSCYELNCTPDARAVEAVWQLNGS